MQNRGKSISSTQAEKIAAHFAVQNTITKDPLLSANFRLAYSVCNELVNTTKDLESIKALMESVLGSDPEEFDSPEEHVDYVKRLIRAVYERLEI